jgi:hypothetical protein
VCPERVEHQIGIIAGPQIALCLIRSVFSICMY